MEARIPLDPEEQAVVSEFLARLFVDREAGHWHPLAHYQAQFPGQERRIAHEFAALESTATDPLDGHAPGTLGGYRLERELGCGGQGRVYLAREQASGQLFALKSWNAALVLDPLGRLRMEREVGALARLAHPGLVRSVALGEDQGCPFVLMEYVDGPSLADLLRRSARPEAGLAWPRAERLRLVETVARAAHAAHEAGVLHRDIKPSNVILRADGSPVLIDFGLALTEGLTRITRAGQHVGTPAYLPPEILRGQRFDRRSDVYMLGALLYEVLTLRPPFEAPSRLLLYERILVQSPRDPRREDPHFLAGLWSVIATALAKEPARRYASAEELADDLRRIQEGRRPRVRPQGPLARARALVGRRPRLAAALTVLVLGSIAAALTFQVLGARTRATLARVEHGARVRSAVHLAALAQDADWPETPASLPALDAWLAEVGPLRQELAHSLAAEPATTAELLPLLTRLSAAQESSQRRRDAAARLVQETLVTPAQAWADAARAVAASPLYAGLALEAQLGLVPLGLDPRSGLLECAHPRSGSVPRRDASTGRLAIGPDTGLVFVLIPGGTFRMGSEPPSAGHPAGSANVDERATDTGEWPIRTARVAPFFLSKYELTQGQWLRLSGSTPSRWQPQRDAHDRITLAHPLENVHWRAAQALLARFELELPSEAQWEYAARAGTTTPWSSGEDPGSLPAHANLLDQQAASLWQQPLAPGAPARDGHVEHAPVGSFLPNAFGLHDVHGNVWEWCADAWEFPLAGTPAPRAADGTPMRVLKGGGFDSSAWHGRSARRDYAGELERTFSRGVRPARALRSPPSVAQVSGIPAGGGRW